RFQHHRLVAVDGTDIELASDDRLRKHFSVRSNGRTTADGKPPPHAGMVVLQDISHDLPIDYSVTTSKPNERECLLSMLDRLKPGDVVIADRGFPSKEVFHALADRNIDFIMRIPKNTLKAVDTFRQSDDDEAVIEIDTADAKGRKNIYKRPITLRLIRDKSPNDSGEPRILATTLLDAERYPAEDIIFCYSRRWRIETAYREMKIYAGLENIQARTREGVLQEIAALVVFQILIGELAGLVRHHHPKETEPVRVACYKANPKKMSARTPKSEPDYTTVTAWECPYNFNRQLMRTCMQGLMKHAFAEDYKSAARSLSISVIYLWRLKQKRREGRSQSRKPKSANAKNINQRRSAKNKRIRNNPENA
ncbi:MAG: IS4 family transposase, partial [Planctomycetota bacterium]